VAGSILCNGGKPKFSCIVLIRLTDMILFFGYKIH
jgi:hypothetical protein